MKYTSSQWVLLRKANSWQLALKTVIIISFSPTTLICYITQYVIIGMNECFNVGKYVTLFTTKANPIWYRSMIRVNVWHMCPRCYVRNIFFCKCLEKKKNITFNDFYFIFNPGVINCIQAFYSISPWNYKMQV